MVDCVPRRGPFPGRHSTSPNVLPDERRRQGRGALRRQLHGAHGHHHRRRRFSVDGALIALRGPKAAVRSLSLCAPRLPGVVPRRSVARRELLVPRPRGFGALALRPRAADEKRRLRLDRRRVGGAARRRDAPRAAARRRRRRGVPGGAIRVFSPSRRRRVPVAPFHFVSSPGGRKTLPARRVRHQGHAGNRPRRQDVYARPPGLVRRVRSVRSFASPRRG
mmetsp:Transcript_30298/g.102191  ORF Transcript_30298/g.102191 Transcript_30298/m.102191 type:complete len:221 (-) Transcript_30298:595-1257(-)